MATKIIPINDQVLVRRNNEEKEATSRGGIILSPAHQEKPLEGEVLATGKGVLTSDGTRVPLEVEVGHKVMFQKGAGSEITVEGEKYLMLREHQILCIMLPE